MNQQLQAMYSEIPEYPYCGRFPQAKNVPVVRAARRQITIDTFVWYCLYFDLFCVLVVLVAGFVTK
jgi:hypothetical protein